MLATVVLQCISMLGWAQSNHQLKFKLMLVAFIYKLNIQVKGGGWFQSLLMKFKLFYWVSESGLDCFICKTWQRIETHASTCRWLNRHQWRGNDPYIKDIHHIAMLDLYWSAWKRMWVQCQMFLPKHLIFLIHSKFQNSITYVCMPVDYSHTYFARWVTLLTKSLLSIKGCTSMICSLNEWEIQTESYWAKTVGVSDGEIFQHSLGHFWENIVFAL